MPPAMSAWPRKSAPRVGATLVDSLISLSETGRAPKRSVL